MADVTDIFRYPLKGGRAEALAVACLDQFGIEGDHRYGILDLEVYAAKGRKPLLNQNALAGIAIVSLDDSSPYYVRLRDNVPGKEVGKTALLLTGGDGFQSIQKTVTLGGEKTPVNELYTPDAAVKLAEFLGINKQLSLVMHDGRAPVRQIDPNCPSTQGAWGSAALQGASPVHIISNQTVKAMSNIGVEDGQPPHGADRYRPTIVLDVDKPFGEDELLGSRIQIGDVCLRVYGPALRCPIPGINQVTGLKDLFTGKMWKARTKPDAHSGKPKVMVGVYAVHENPGQIAVGQEVILLD